MSYYDDFDLLGLGNCYVELKDRLKLLGQLYDEKTQNPNEAQKEMLELDSAGYELGEQIHDCYAEMGSVMNAIEKNQDWNAITYKIQRKLNQPKNTG